MWYKGYTHHHTSFHYPLKQRITPEELIEDLKRLGASFTFCAGDHGDKEGNNYWGMDAREYPDYKEACFSASKNSGVVLAPAPEIHLKFPPFIGRHEHHSCVPILDYLPELAPPEARALALSYTRKVDNFICEAHHQNLSLTLNHPYLSCLVFGGPDPLNIPSLYQIDYLELYTIDWPEYFPYDFDLYLKFLSHPLSSIMGCCAGVDNARTPWKLLSDEARIIPTTYLYVPGTFTRESLMQAWNERSSYTAYGNIYLEEINPIPAKKFIKGTRPNIKMSIKNSGKKKFIRIKIYRNGKKIYENICDAKDKYDLIWEDNSPFKGENHYIVHIEAGGEHLIISPINYFSE